MKNLRILIFVLYLVAFFSSPLYGQTEDISTILEKVLEAAGGRSQWETVKTRIDFCENTHSSNMLNVNSLFSYLEHSTVIKWYKKIDKDNHLEKMITVDKLNIEDTFSTCYNGVMYWAQSTNSEPITFDSFVERYGKFVNCGYPDQLLRADSIIYSDSINAKEELYEVIEVYTYGTLSVYYINKKDYLVEKIIFNPRPTLKQSQTTITYLGKYKLVQGRKIPFLRETFQNDKLAMKLKYKEVIFNSNIDSSLFEFSELPPYSILNNSFKNIVE